MILNVLWLVIQNVEIWYNICYSDKIGVPHIIFNNIDCYFKKNGNYSFLVFCDNEKNKTMINIYLKIIKQLHDRIFSFIDEFEDEYLFLMVIPQNLDLKLMIIWFMMRKLIFLLV